MLNIPGFTSSGRQMHGPGSNLEELQDGNGYRNTAIVFHPEYRDNPVINSGLSIVLNFLESPMVSGLVELAAHDREEGAFVYPTGPCWSVAEINRKYADLGLVPGIRAGIELMLEAGRVLAEASEMGFAQGIECHGGLTPWRVMVADKGQVSIIGYGLPQVEILHFLDHPEANPREDSFRYATPERLDRKHEDLSADFFSLALIAFEFMTGKPVYDGLVNEIRAKASRADSAKRLFKFQNQIPARVMEILKTAMRREPRDRYRDGRSFTAALQQALSAGDVTGPSLMDVMDKVVHFQEKPGQELNPSETHAITPAMRAALLGGAEPVRAEPPPPRAEPPAPRVERPASRIETPEPRAEPPRPAAPSSPPIGVRQVRRGNAPPPAFVSSMSAEPPAPARVEPVQPPVAPAASPRVSFGTSTAPESLAAPTSSPAGESRGAWSRPEPRRVSYPSQEEQLPQASPAPPMEPVPLTEDRSRTPDPNTALRASTSRMASSLVESIVGGAGARLPSLRREGALPSPQGAVPAAPARPEAPAPPRPIHNSLDLEGPSYNGARSQSPPPAFGTRPPERSEPQSPTPAPSQQQSARAPALPPGLPPSIASRSVLPSMPSAPSVVAAPASAPPELETRVEAPPRPSAFPPSLPVSAPVVRESAPTTPLPPAVAPTTPKVVQASSPPAVVTPPPVSAPRRPAVPPPVPAIESPPRPAERVEPPSAVQSPELVPARSVIPSDPPRPPAAVNSAEIAANGGFSWRLPDSLPTDSARGASAVYTIRRGANGRALRYRLPVQASVADAVGILLGTMIPVRTDFAGRISGWCRLALDGRILPADTLLSGLDPNRPLDLAFVENQSVPVELEVRGPQVTVTLRVQMGTAVPTSSILDHAATMCSLPEGDWRLVAGGRTLGSHDILADLGPCVPPLKLVMEKK